MPSTSPDPRLTERSETKTMSASRTVTSSTTKRDASAIADLVGAGPEHDPVGIELDGEQRSARVASENFGGQLDRPRTAHHREALRAPSLGADRPVLNGQRARQCLRDLRVMGDHD